MKKESIAIIGGNILIPDSGENIIKSILIEDGVVSLLERSKIVKNIAHEKNIPIINIKGQTIMPGPIDTHFHLLQTGIHLSSIDFSLCRSIDEILQLIRENVCNTENDKWIFGKGLDEFNLKEKRTPTAKEIDTVSQALPVIIEDRGLHYCILNTLAFNKLRISPYAPGVIKHNNGKTITGQLMEEIVSEARRRLMRKMDKKQIKQFIFEGAKFAASCGITTLHAMEGEQLFGDEKIPDLLEMRDKLPIRISLHWNTFDYKAVKKAGLRVLGGDIFIDGSVGSHTAAFRKPYTDNPNTTGLLYYKSEEIERLIQSCVSNNIQVGFHAIGNRAIEQVITAFENVAKKNHLPDRGFRIDHFGYPDSEQIARAADLGVVIATQPTFPYIRGGLGSVYETRLGPKRERRAYPLREFINAGLLIAGGSDHVVAPAEIMLGIHAAVNHPHEEQRLSVREAIRLYTINAAKIEYEEKLKGTLSIGKLGDLIVLNKNPYDVEEKKIRDISVMMTIVNGSVVYKRRADRKK